jgi:phenylalanyl-tRNA synthetase beta chain
MKFTFNWLKEFVACNSPPERLAELLTMAGLEVESLTPVREPETNAQDWLFEVSVTPNRGDCLGISGIAREVAALTGAALKAPALMSAGQASGTRATVAIESPELCPRYSARIVEQLRVGPAPAWMRFRLESCGIRTINVIVDVTNYVMLETGQPLHAFDLNRLPARQIVVRQAREIDRFTTLDGVERPLAPEDLLICDGAVPVALAGIMGGLNSEVGGATTALLLESASFDPIAIRRTAKRLGLHSEASHRFERGVDPEGTLTALDRSVYLLARLAEARAESAPIDRYPRPPEVSTIVVREERIERLLGVRIEAGAAARLLGSLGLKTQLRGDVIEVVRSSRRPDLTREADVVEELARLHGYQNIPSTLPLLRASGGKKDHRLASERRVRSFLAGEGLAEAINLPFTTEQLNRLFAGLWDGPPAPVAVLNPLTKDSAEMRLSLIPGLLENLRLNLAQRAASVHAYHLGKAFRLRGGAESEERHCLGGVLYGPRPRHGLRQAQESAPGFLECKGLIEGLLDLLHTPAVRWDAETVPDLHPGKTAALYCGETRLGYLGEIHPELCEALAVPPCFVFELDFDSMLEYAPRQVTARALPRFPSVERDLAVVVDVAFPSQQIVSWISNLGEALIEHVAVFDQYRGSPIPEGKKSLAYKISYRADDRTLTDAEVQTLHHSIVQRIAEVFGAQLRS